MKHKTYQTLYQAHLGNVNRAALLEARAEETDPFYHNLIDLMLEEKRIPVDWDVASFTDKFRSVPAREKLDETVFAFLLRLVAINKEERYLRAFQKPESQNAIMAWDSLLRIIFLCTLALLYNVRWTIETNYKYLEPAIMSLLIGDSSALRELMKSMGISLAKETPYKAELQFQDMNFLHTGQYSSFYWRYLHWMAEAFHLRKNVPEMAYYREVWRQLLDGSLYRTLRCGVCMFHFREMLQELQPQLTDDNTDFPKLWFDMHNRVHTQRREQYPLLKEPDYTESEYAEDREFMLQALSP